MSEPFNLTQYIADQNAAESAQTQAAVTPAAEPKPPAVEAKPTPETPKPAEPPAEDEAHTLRRQEVRRLKQLEKENATLSGRLSAFEEQWKAQQAGKPAEPPPDPNAKPTRVQYANDADFMEAMGRWGARQEGEKVAQQRQFEDAVSYSDRKASEDLPLLPDWEANMAAFQASGLDWVPDEHPTLRNLIITSPHKAFALNYLVTHTDELEEFLALRENPTQLIAEFRALEGHVKRIEKAARAAAAKGPMGTAEPESAPESAPKKPAAKAQEPEEEAVPVIKRRLPAPSEASTPKGGNAPNMDIPPTLANGKINPAWLKARNEEESRR